MHRRYRWLVAVLGCVAVLALAGTADAALFTFGSTDSTISAQKDTLLLNFKGVNVMTSPKAGTLTKVEGYFDGLGAGSGSEKVRAIVYSIDASNNPTTFLGVSGEIVVNAGAAAGWRTFTFPGSISIPAGKIGIGYWSGGATVNLIRPSYDVNAGTIKYNTGQTYSSTGNPSNPFGSATTGSQGKPWVIRVTADDGVAPPTYPKYGIQDGALINNGTFNATDRDFYLNEAKAAGAGVYRVGFWTGAETATDAVISKLNTLGIEPLILIGGSVSAPGPSTSTTASLCQAASLRYPAVRLFELWNEPNIHGWTGSTYKPHLQACYNAIKALNPADQMLVGGLAHAWQGVGTNQSIIHFMEQLYAAGGGPFFDMANVHPYNDPADHYVTSGRTCQDGGGNPWDQTWGYSGTCASGYMRAVMNSNGDSAKPIAATEAGETITKTTEAGQATIVQHALQDTRPNMVIIYSNDDLEVPGFGIHRADKSRRPAFASMQAVTGGTG
jgi:hypothetical protein